MGSHIGFTLQEWVSSQRQNPMQILQCLEEHLKLIQVDNAWITLASLEQIRGQVIPLIERYTHHPESLPLFGVPFAVKDNIDVAGWATTAGCPAFSYIAEQDAFVVAQLKAAGAIVLGKTNLDQFATGLVGTRSPYGEVENTFDSDYISGGSSSGSASVVARGLVAFALGTDTAGSGRVPAGFNNIVGLKPTKGWFSASGVVPACRLNDTISIFALRVEDAYCVAEIAGKYDTQDPYARHHPGNTPAALPLAAHFAVPAAPQFFDDSLAEQAWYQALDALKASGATIHPIDFSLFYQLAEQLYAGPWVAERTVAVGDMLMSPHQMDPVVEGIVRQGLTYSAVEVYQAEYLRAELAREIQNTIRQYDALVVPTSPTIRTRLEITEQPILFNSQLGIYTNFTNLADLSALALPGPWRGDGLPAGITLLSLAWCDRALAEFGVRWQRQLALPLGATDRALPYSSSTLPASKKHVRVAVVGAHLTGMPLNKQLTSRQATLVEQTQTAAEYRLFALPGDGIKKPGLLRDEGGGAIEVELWDIPIALFGEFVAEIPAPLGIGTLFLADGRAVKGFICEPYGLSQALDITSWTGWRNWLAAQALTE